MLNDAVVGECGEVVVVVGDDFVVVSGDVDEDVIDSRNFLLP